MSYLSNNIVIDLDPNADADQAPIKRFVNLTFFMAIHASAERLEIVLEHSEQKESFQIFYVVKGQKHEMVPPPARLFKPIVVMLCNCASVPYYSKGPVKGQIETKNPYSTWLFESDDLQKRVVLSKI
jgi:hypothetical protein